jgi:HPt (histidine-containing phosphotransfer) domain-containing protein
VASLFVLKMIGEKQMNQLADKETDAPILEMSRLAALRSFQMPGEPDLVIELFDVFLQNASKHLSTLAEAWRELDVQKLKKGAHAFKSGARTLGAVRLGDSCDSLEEICTAAAEDKIPESIEKINREYQLLVAEIERARKLLAKLPSAT